MAEEKRTVTIHLPNLNLWMIISIVLGIALVLSLTGMIPTGRIVATGGLTASDAANKAINYLQDMGYDCTLVSVEETNGIYKVTTSYQGSNIPVYITKDGVYLFLSSPVDTTETVTTTTQPQEIPKSDKPEVHAFVMSYCPYGLQFLKAYIPVMELFGEKADMEVNFVSYAMHGEKEVYENLRMYCIQKEQKDKFTDYLRCFVKAGDYESCINEVGIDETGLDTCMNETDEEFEITKKLNDQSTWSGSYPPFDADKELCEQYGVGGSPTFVINGQEVSVNRSPEAIKEVICQAFNTPPEECNQQLSTTAEQAGLGEIGSGTGSASSSGGCA